MVSLLDTGGELAIVFEDTESPERARWRVRFRKYPAYRNIDESYRVALWQWLDESGQRCGFTFTVTEPVAFASWAGAHLYELVPAPQHFVIATNDDVIEVLSGEVPIWEGTPQLCPTNQFPGSRPICIGAKTTTRSSVSFWICGLGTDVGSKRSRFDSAKVRALAGTPFLESATDT